MVGSSLAPAVIVAILALGTVSGNICHDVDPKHQGFVRQLSTYSCLYARLVQQPQRDLAMAKKECESLDGNGYPHKWRLVEPKTKQIHDEVQRVLGILKEDLDAIWGWIGLVRDSVQRGSTVDKNGWADGEKWRWGSDNSTLNTSFDGQPPWSLDEPNGYVRDTRQRCVFTTKYAVDSGDGWADNACDGIVIFPRRSALQVLLCETDTTITTTSTTSSTTSTSTMTTTTSSTTSTAQETTTIPTEIEATTSPKLIASTQKQIEEPKTGDNSGGLSGWAIGIIVFLAILIILLFILVIVAVVVTRRKRLADKEKAMAKKKADEEKLARQKTSMKKAVNKTPLVKKSQSSITPKSISLAFDPNPGGADHQMRVSLRDEISSKKVAILKKSVSKESMSKKSTLKKTVSKKSVLKKSMSKEKGALGKK